MKLYIEIENNQPKNHPAFENNLLEAFGEIPEHWVPFVRVGCPALNVYEIYDGATYEIVNGVYTDVHHIRNMTVDEKLNLQNAVKQNWNTTSNYLSWIFDEETCKFIPPISYPSDGQNYIWDEETLNWIKFIPPEPTLE